MADEIADPERYPFHTGYLGRNAVSYQMIDGRAIVEGDIIIGPADRISTVPYSGEPEPVLIEGLVEPNRLWGGGTLRYRIDSGLPNPERVEQAIKHWQANTKMNFRWADAGTNSYVVFVRGAYSSSYVGLQGGRQEITVADQATWGNIVHEIGHAFGLYHEHCRADRKKSISIHDQNIIPSAKHNFKETPAGMITLFYDYESIMHYSNRAFSQNGSDTLTPKIAGVTIGQRDGLSLGDVLAINAAYSGEIGDAVAFYISNENSGKVIDIKDASKFNAWVIQYEKLGAWNQQWYIHNNGPIYNEGADKVLDVYQASTYDGAWIITYPWDEHKTNQRWSIDRDSLPQPHYRIRSSLNDFALAVQGASKDNGAYLQNVKADGGGTHNHMWWKFSLV